MEAVSRAGVKALWDKVKAHFGAELSVSGPTITLKNKAATPTNLSQVTIPNATTSTAGAMSAQDKARLDGLVASGGEPNQNAFAKVSAGGVTVAADMVSDTLSIAAGANVTVEANAATDTVTISAKDTVYEHPSSHPASMIAQDADHRFATDEEKASWSAKAEASHAHTPKSIGAAAEDHGHPSYAPLASPSLTGTPKAPTATAGTNNTQIATTAFVNAAVSAAAVGAAKFQGTASAQSDIEGAAYRKGMYWVVASAGAFAGEDCEPGDMVFCCADRASAYKPDDFSVVQNNIVELTAADVEAICV